MSTNKHHLALVLFALSFLSGCNWMKKKTAKQETALPHVTPEKMFVHEETEMKTVLPTDVQNPYQTTTSSHTNDENRTDQKNP